MPAIVLQSIRCLIHSQFRALQFLLFLVSYFLFIFLSLSIFLFSFNFLFPRMETKDGIRGRAVAREGKLGDESPPIESVEKEKATS